jgi:hypothetical protein
VTSGRHPVAAQARIDEIRKQLVGRCAVTTCHHHGNITIADLTDAAREIEGLAVELLADGYTHLAAIAWAFAERLDNDAHLAWLLAS